LTEDASQADRVRAYIGTGAWLDGTVTPLYASAISVLPPMVTPDDMRWVELAGYDCEASRRILAALEWVHQQQEASHA
jgi:hypothetical protein